MQETNIRGVTTLMNKKYLYPKEYYLKGNNPIHAVTFDPEIAEKERNAFFITAVHPLVKQAAAYFSQNKVVYIHLDYYSEDIPEGDYSMAIYAWNYVGIRSDFRLIAICEDSRIEAELPDYILTASAAGYNIEPDSKAWETLEEQHIKKWQEEKTLHIVATKQLASYKLGSINNNYLNRKQILERKILEDEDERIRTMHKSELENATLRYKLKTSEIEEQIAKADIHTTLISKGIITVKH